MARSRELTRKTEEGWGGKVGCHGNRLHVSMCNVSRSGLVPGRGGKVDASAEHSWVSPSAPKVIHHDLGHQESSDEVDRETVRVRGEG